MTYTGLSLSAKQVARHADLMWWAGACIALLAAHPACAQQAEQAPIAVLTDTVEYCDQLQLRLNRCAVRTAEVSQLVKQGRQMCDHGEIRGGIAALRRAIMMQKHIAPCR